MGVWCLTNVVITSHCVAGCSFSSILSRPNIYPKRRRENTVTNHTLPSRLSPCQSEELLCSCCGGSENQSTFINLSITSLKHVFEPVVSHGFAINAELQTED